MHTLAAACAVHCSCASGGSCCCGISNRRATSRPTATVRRMSCAVRSRMRCIAFSLKRSRFISASR